MNNAELVEVAELLESMDVGADQELCFAAGVLRRLADESLADSVAWRPDALIAYRKELLREEP